MTYLILRYVHLLGLTLMGAGLIGVWYADLRSRQVRDLDLPLLGELVRQIAVFYDGLVVPGALMLLGSGTWLTITAYGGWAFLHQPWLAGMVALFAFEFIEGNTITRRYFMRLRRLTKVALAQGSVTRELEMARREHLPTFTHFLDLPIFFVIVALGAMRPNTWTLFLVGMALAVIAATLLAVDQAGHGKKKGPPPGSKLGRSCDTGARRFPSGLDSGIANHLDSRAFPAAHSLPLLRAAIDHDLDSAEEGVGIVKLLATVVVLLLAAPVLAVLFDDAGRITCHKACRSW